MKKRFLPLMLCSLLTSLLSGCGTFADSMMGPADERLYYRGVRMDVEAIKKGTAVMAIDLPLSACADTILIPSIAYHQFTDPPGTKFKPAMQSIGEEMGKAVATEVLVPMAVEMQKTMENDPRLRQSPESPYPAVGSPAAQGTATQGPIQQTSGRQSGAGPNWTGWKE
jgi:uncharacterized protein YceK